MHLEQWSTAGGELAAIKELRNPVGTRRPGHSGLSSEQETGLLPSGPPCSSGCLVGGLPVLHFPEARGQYEYEVEFNFINVPILSILMVFFGGRGLFRLFSPFLVLWEPSSYAHYNLRHSSGQRPAEDQRERGAQRGLCGHPSLTRQPRRLSCPPVSNTLTVPCGPCYENKWPFQKVSPGV